MTTYEKYDDLKGKTLEYGDTVKFHYKKESVTYKVGGKYLNAEDNENYRIFRMLEMTIDSEIYEYASKSYGYSDNVNGGWPEYHSEDYEAATRFALEIYKRINPVRNNWKEALEQ